MFDRFPRNRAEMAASVRAAHTLTRAKKLPPARGIGDDTLARIEATQESDRLWAVEQLAKRNRSTTKKG